MCNQKVLHLGVNDYRRPVSSRKFSLGGSSFDP